MKLRLTPRAARDLADIGDYLWERSPGAALRVRDTILQSVQNLSQFPELGRKREPGMGTTRPKPVRKSQKALPSDLPWNQSARVNQIRIPLSFIPEP